MQQQTWRNYAQLMRLDKPVGIALLFWPCAWSLTLAAEGAPPAPLLLLFLLGAILMRAAGCIINDMTDRRIDAQVERTRERPLASGRVTMKEAWILLTYLLGLSLVVACALGEQLIKLAALWLLPVAFYPWMKRITWWPQLFLGLTFNVGALFGWLALRGDVTLPAWLIYAGGVCWTLGYDTIYAHQDIADDKRVGVKSSARRLGKATKPAVVSFYGFFILCLAWAGYESGAAYPYFFALIPAFLHLIWQIVTVRLDSPADCLRVFRSNHIVGLLIFLACLAA